MEIHCRPRYPTNNPRKQKERVKGPVYGMKARIQVTILISEGRQAEYGGSF
jgi:hypothetical protein